MKKDRFRLLAAALLAAGLALRLIYAYRVYRAHDLPGLSTAAVSLSIDPDGYNLLAENLLKSGTYRMFGKLDTDREPFYPLVLAAIHGLLGPSPVPGIVFNALVGVGCCWLACLIALCLFDNRLAALISLAAAAFYPEWIYYGAYFYREPLMTLLLGLWIWLWLSRGSRSEIFNHALMGLSFGLLGLTRSAMLPLGAAFVPIAALRIEPRRWLKTLGLFIICACAVQAPWAWRNYKVTGRLVAGSTMGGSMMYLSLLKNYDLPDQPLEAPLAAEATPLIARIKSQKISLAQAQTLYYRASWNILLHKPGVFWGAFFHKALKFWRLYPTPGWHYGQREITLMIVGLVSNGLLLLLGLWGAFLAWRRNYEVGFLLSIPAVTTLICALYWAVMRFHTPVMLVFMPLAGYCAADILGRRSPS
ncbi:MAG TPA: glycosyltransferase family 39 protein [Elusimicrobiota bacterium]|nr:glycosyltransferase family 39 protein [Elusimicrobiota bacterium]